MRILLHVSTGCLGCPCFLLVPLHSKGRKPKLGKKKKHHLSSIPAKKGSCNQHDKYRIYLYIFIIISQFHNQMDIRSTTQTTPLDMNMDSPRTRDSLWEIWGCSQPILLGRKASACPNPDLCRFLPKPYLTQHGVFTRLWFSSFQEKNEGTGSEETCSYPFAKTGLGGPVLVAVWRSATLDS